MARAGYLHGRVGGFAAVVEMVVHVVVERVARAHDLVVLRIEQKALHRAEVRVGVEGCTQRLDGTGLGEHVRVDEEQVVAARCRDARVVRLAVSHFLRALDELDVLVLVGHLARELECVGVHALVGSHDELPVGEVGHGEDTVEEVRLQGHAVVECGDDADIHGLLLGLRGGTTPL